MQLKERIGAKKYLAKITEIIYFAVVALFCGLSVLVFFIRLNQFGPTIANAAVIAGIFFIIFTEILSGKAEGRKFFYSLSKILILISVTLMYTVNLIKFI